MDSFRFRDMISAALNTIHHPIHGPNYSEGWRDACRAMFDRLDRALRTAATPDADAALCMNARQLAGLAADVSLNKPLTISKLVDVDDVRTATQPGQVVVLEPGQAAPAHQYLPTHGGRPAGGKMTEAGITVREAELHAGARTLIGDDQLAALRINLQRKVTDRIETLNDLLLLQLIDQVLSKRRADVAPGAMRCAKCKFKLIRTSLNVDVGTATAGDNQSEPCPNGCGPLWPVTWREEAIENLDANVALFERAKAAEDRLAADQHTGTIDGAVRVDAARYRMLRYQVAGRRHCDPRVLPSFDLSNIKPLPGVDILKGSVAQHLDAALDSALTGTEGQDIGGHREQRADAL